MIETYVFNDIDNMYTFTVKGDFLQVCEQPEKEKTYNLLTKYKMNQFLHNPIGPAIIRIRDNRLEYWIDGSKASDEEAEKIKFNYDFDQNVIKELTNETNS